MIITLSSLIFTELCDAVEEGEEIMFTGIDERNNRGDSVTIPAQVVGNLTIDGQPGGWDEEEPEEDESE